MHLKVGDIVRVGGKKVDPEIVKRNAGRFRTITGFFKQGEIIKGASVPNATPGAFVQAVSPTATLDGPLEYYVQNMLGERRWISYPAFPVEGLIKVDPGDGEDEILTRVGKPESELIKA